MYLAPNTLHDAFWRAIAALIEAPTGSVPDALELLSEVRGRTRQALAAMQIDVLQNARHREARRSSRAAHSYLSRATDRTLGWVPRSRGANAVAIWSHFAVELRFTAVVAFDEISTNLQAG